MITQLQIYILLGAIVASFGTGVLVEHKFSVASEVNHLYEQIAATKEAQQAAEGLAGEVDTKTSELAVETDLNKDKLYEEISKNPTHCNLPPATIELLKQTARAANSAASSVHP